MSNVGLEKMRVLAELKEMTQQLLSNKYNFNLSDKTDYEHYLDEVRSYCLEKVI